MNPSMGLFGAVHGAEGPGRRGCGVHSCIGASEARKDRQGCEAIESFQTTARTTLPDGAVDAYPPLFETFGAMDGAEELQGWIHACLEQRGVSGRGGPTKTHALTMDRRPRKFHGHLAWLRSQCRLLSAICVALVASGPVAADPVVEGLVAAAIARTEVAVRYDPSYRAIAYPGGDVRDDRGVCTDVVIRSYRAIGFDLQQAVHEDMTVAFDAYPSREQWGLERPDPNIDHRRVPNLQVFFKRVGAEVPVTDDPSDYQPGDVVTWLLFGRLPHIGIVTDRIHPVSGEPLIAHNAGDGTRLDDMLFTHPITGHYRYLPAPELADTP